jgi:hypothetical protein
MPKNPDAMDAYNEARNKPIIILPHKLMSDDGAKRLRETIRMWREWFPVEPKPWNYNTDRPATIPLGSLARLNPGLVK